MRRCLLLLIAAACSDGTGPGEGRLPARMRLVAQAEGSDQAGIFVQCHIETSIALTGEQDDRAGAVVYFAEGGGDASRRIDREGANSVAFWADTYFESLEFHLIHPDSIEIRSPQSEDTESRFWHEFAVFPGHTRNASTETGEVARGTWTCRPMDTPESSGEYYDPVGSAEGTWTLNRED
jgi:hypothetical protein